MSAPIRTLLALGIAAAALAAPAGAGADTIVSDASPDGINGDVDCSLREAVQATNTNATVGACVHDGGVGHDTISLEAETYFLSTPGTGEGANATGDLDVDTGAGGLTIDGAGAGSTTIQAVPIWDDRVLQRSFGSGVLTLSDLSLTGGKSTDGSQGGGIASVGGGLTLLGVRVTGNDDSSGGGGVAAASGSSLTITDSTIEDNDTTGIANGGGVLALNVTSTTIDSSAIRDNTASSSITQGGGGLKVTGGPLEMIDSVVEGNDLTDTDATGLASGGGVLATGDAEFRGTTIAGNRVIGAGARRGGGIFGSGGILLVNSTVSGNEALGTNAAGGGVHVDGLFMTMFQATIAGNTAGDLGGGAVSTTGFPVNLGTSVLDAPSGTVCAGTGFGSNGDNVLGDNTCGSPDPSDAADVDPLLGALADDGGADAGAPGFLEPRLVQRPAASSPAVDRVATAACTFDGNPLTVDQLGALRPQDGDDADAIADCDSGAIEISATPVTNPPDTGGDPTPTLPKKCKKGRKLKKGKCVKKKKRRRK